MIHHKLIPFLCDVSYLPQGGSVSDGEQGDASIFGSLEDFSFHVNAHSTGTLIQQGILRPNRQGEMVLIVSIHPAVLLMHILQ